MPGFAVHVLFLAPESQVYYREFARGLKEVGARVTGLGHAPPARLPARLRPYVDEYVPVTDADVREFTERHGFPIVVKPRAGFGSLNTHRVDSAADLDRLLPTLALGRGRSVAVEEAVDGHEGFHDTIMLDESPGHEFISHYYPGCLEAAKVNRLLGLSRTATHMEWFFGSKGLKFSEIGARPAGERIWDMYRVANEFDVYREWASAVVHGRTSQAPTRKYAVGSIQVRPSRDGRYLRHEGLDRALREVGRWIYESEVPVPGSPTQPLEKGWLVNTWFRLRHPDYDRLRELMTFLGRTVKAVARP